LQIREKRWREPAVGEFDHRFRAVYAKYRPIWNVRRKLGGYLPSPQPMSSTRSSPGKS